MAFPDEPLPVGIELQIDGVWTDITEHVYLRDRITITRGRGDEADQVEPASCKLTLNNRDGRYSPKNPRSPYYGLIGRNTPIRVYVEHGDVALTNLGGAGARVTCPDASGLDITGDIDIRVDLTANDWSTGGNLAGKYAISDQRSWILNVGSDDLLALIWSPDGTLASRQFALSTEPIPMAPGRRALRATLDVDNGSGGHTVRFYTAPTIAGPWTQLGDAVTGSGTTSIYAGTASVEVGDVQDLEGHSFAGRYHAVQILSGIGGTAVADVDFSAQTPGATSFTDDAGNTWTLQDNVVLDRRSYRWRRASCDACTRAPSRSNPLCAARSRGPTPTRPGGRWRTRPGRRRPRPATRACLRCWRPGTCRSARRRRGEPPAAYRSGRTGGCSTPRSPGAAAQVGWWRLGICRRRRASGRRCMRLR